jgi:hypothetical protein
MPRYLGGLKHSCSVISNKQMWMHLDLRKTYMRLEPPVNLEFQLVEASKPPVYVCHCDLKSGHWHGWNLTLVLALVPSHR